MTVPSALVPQLVSVHTVPGRMLLAPAIALKLWSVIVSSKMPSAPAKAIMKLLPAIW